jgi:hypothetical protein
MIGGRKVLYKKCSNGLETLLEKHDINVVQCKAKNVTKRWASARSTENLSPASMVQNNCEVQYIIADIRCCLAARVCGFNGSPRFSQWNELLSILVPRFASGRNV